MPTCEDCRAEVYETGSGYFSTDPEDNDAEGIVCAETDAPHTVKDQDA